MRRPIPGSSGPIATTLGDDGLLKKSKCQVRRHNPDGDALFIDGVISQKARTHRDELSATGASIVELPSRG